MDGNVLNPSNLLLICNLDKGLHSFVGISFD